MCKNVWTIDSPNSGSWIWKLGSGITASLWHDNWTGLGPLFELTGPTGPRDSGMDFNATVAEGITNGNWWIHTSRSRNPVLSLLHNCLPPVEPILNSEADDLYLWKIGDDAPTTSFRTSLTWASACHPKARLQDLADHSQQATYS